MTTQEKKQIAEYYIETGNETYEIDNDLQHDRISQKDYNEIIEMINE